MIRGLEDAFGPFELVASRARTWASATFDGARHVLDVRAPVERFADIGVRELPIGETHFVAAISARTGSDVTVIEALTIVDAGRQDQDHDDGAAL